MSEAHGDIGSSHDALADDERDQSVTVVGSQDQLVGVRMHAGDPALEHLRRRAFDSYVGMALGPTHVNPITIPQQIAQFGNLRDTKAPHPAPDVMAHHASE